MNQARFTWHSVPSYFTTDVWSYITIIKTNYYRPVFMSWLLINYKLFGVDTTLWHLGAILAHLAATFLVYRLALRLLGDRLSAAGAALLFGVHPVHVEAVTWVSGATETVLAVFGLGAILSHMEWRDRKSAMSRRAWRISELALFALALLSKETAIIIPVLVFAWEWFYSPGVSGESKKRKFTSALASIFPYFYIVLVYFFARHHALGGFSPMVRQWTWPMVIATWPLALTRYLRLLVFPGEYSLFYPILPVKHFGLTEILRDLLPVVLAASALVWLSLRSRLAAFCSLLLVIPILPALNLRVFAFDDFLHDRYLYLPSVGFCILAAAGLEYLVHDVRVRTVIVIAAVVVLGAVAVKTSLYWNDNLALYTHTVDVAPESAVAAEYLGEELLERDRWAEALPILNRALVQDPTSYDMYIRIAKCYVGLGETDEAISYFKDAITLFPYVPNAYVNLAVVEYRANLFPDAETHMRQALQLRPRYSPVFNEYHLRLGKILEGEKKWSDALQEYRAELTEDPANEDALEATDRLAQKLTQQ